MGLLDNLGNGADGDAATSEPSTAAPATGDGATPAGVSAPPEAPAVPEGEQQFSQEGEIGAGSGITDDAFDAAQESLITESTEKDPFGLPEDPNQQPVPSSAEPKEGGEPDTEAQLAQMKKDSEDPNLPGWARDKVKNAYGLATKQTQAAREAQEQLEAASTRFEGLEGFDSLGKADIERMQAAENALGELSSYSLTPEAMAEQLERLNPDAHKAYQSQAVWNALFDDSGTANMESWQKVIDQKTGWTPESGQDRVYAEDAIAAVEAIARGDLSKRDWQNFKSDAEEEAFNRVQESEKATRAAELRAKENEAFHEKQVRQTAMQNVYAQIQTPINQGISKRLTEFNLIPNEDDPQVVQDFKQAAIENINAIMNQSSSIRSFKELETAIDLALKTRGVSAQQAQHDIDSLSKSPQFVQHLSHGTSQILSQIDKAIARSSRFLTLMMKGYEIENKKGTKARDILGAGATDVPDLSADELAKMSGNRHNAHVMDQATKLLRQGPGDRLGGG